MTRTEAVTTPATRITTPAGIAYFHLQRAMTVIETADARLLTVDGPAGGMVPEMSLREWRDLYRSLEKARAALSREAAS